ncbi:hypothetical protein [Cerasicoccus frondis]|uniref:hypothetical protein n=1 Tax=Cerasicoccus frondis TaxID=490090 RepID=UPI0028528118|nr:hypothetical protein [Cerasicoccus frondis]
MPLRQQDAASRKREPYSRDADLEINPPLLRAGLRVVGLLKMRRRLTKPVKSGSAVVTAI